MATIVKQTLSTNDTHTNSAGANTNYINATSTANLYDLGTGTGGRYFVRFSDNDYDPPVGNVVTKVELVLTKFNNTTTSVNFTAYDVLGAFDPSTITFNTMPSIGSAVASSSGTSQVKRLDITNWWLNAKANGANGLYIHAGRGSSNSGIFTADHATPGNRPYLEFTYDGPVISPEPMPGSGLMADPSVVTQNPDVTVTAQTMTSSSLMNNPTITAVKNVVANAQIMTANALMNNAYVLYTSDVNTFADARISNGVLTSQTATNVNAHAGASDARAIFRWTTPAQILDASQIVNASFSITIGSAVDGYNVNVYRITSPWDESTTTAPTIDSTVITNLTGSGAGSRTIDITQYAKDVANGVYPNYGLAIYGYSPSSVIAIYTRESSTGKPVANYVYNAATVINVNPTAQVMTGSANSLDASVSTTNSVSYSAQSMTAIGVFLNANASVVKNMVFNALPMTGSALMNNATAATTSGVIVTAEYMSGYGFILDPTIDTEQIPDVAVTAQSMTANALMVDPAVSAGTGQTVTVTEIMDASALMNDATFSSATPVNYVATAMTGNARMVTPKYINGNDISFYDDPYYVLGKQTTDNDDIWYRLRETTGATVAVDEAGDGTISRRNATIVGNPEFVQGFGTHRAMVFDGLDDYLQLPDSLSEPSLLPGSLEFYIKTVNGNQVIMTGRGYRNIGDPNVPIGTIGQYETVRTSTIDMIDGKIRVHNQREFGNELLEVGQMIGTVNIADGQWHQIAITTWYYPQNYDPGTVPPNSVVRDYENLGLQANGMSIYVDGKLDQRKTFTYGQNPGLVVYIAQPDTIGRVGNSYFTGELSEIIHRAFYSIPKYYIEQLKYAFFQDNPIRPEIMRASAEAGNAKGKGNTKRVLCLYFRFGDDGSASRPGLDKTWSTDVGRNLQPKFGGISDTPRRNSSTDLDDALALFPGAKFFYKNVYQVGTRALVDDLYRDPVTDEPRYINLQTDIDITDFDAVMFADFPGVQYEDGSMIPTRIRGQEFDKFIESFKVAVFDQGLDFYCAMPHVAQYLGLVNGWDSHTITRDSGAIESSALVGLNGGDFESAYNDPFKNTEAYLDRETALRAQLAVNETKHYYDTHTNSSHRIVAKVEGITDMPGYTLVEETYFRDPTYDYLQDLQYSARYVDHPTGLAIGDEFKIDGPIAQTKQAEARVAIQTYNLISFRPDQINVGVALAKQQLYLDDGDLHYLNPQRENATVIVVEPGTMLDGREIKGKIVIDSNDYYAFTQTAYLQDLDNTDWPNQWKDQDNAITKQWNPSTRRIRTSSIRVTFTNSKVITGKNGATALVVESYSRDLAEYGNVINKPVRFVTMQERLWNYILETESESGDGNIKFRAAPMQAQARMVDSGTQAISNKTVVAQPMYAVAQMPKVAEDSNGDAQVFVFASTANAQMINPTKRIFAGAMTADAIMEEPFGMIFDSEDIIYVTLTRPGTITMIRNGDSQ